MVRHDTEVEDGIQAPMVVDDNMRLDVADDAAHIGSSNDDKPASTASPDAAPSSSNEQQFGATPSPDEHEDKDLKTDAQRTEEAEGSGPRRKGRGRQTGATREAQNAARAAKDTAFLESFKPLDDWLPPKTTNADYTPDFCRELERRYWRNCGLGKAPWYGADMQGACMIWLHCSRHATKLSGQVRCSLTKQMRGTSQIYPPHSPDSCQPLPKAFQA